MAITSHEAILKQFSRKRKLVVKIAAEGYPWQNVIFADADENTSQIFTTLNVVFHLSLGYFETLTHKCGVVQYLPPDDHVAIR